ncbi:hypothetical protein G6K62_003856 [Salmonella enterica subsp. enterica serovar Rubislaw]|nr:hypothetical protein [Salmonella enterica subsp. enterica serovar Rubislaw]UAW58882.1 hypothetical protein AVIO78A_097 [Escherichia phage vB_EcoS_AVIO78A]
MTVYEMEGFLRGKCVPGDLKVNETNAEYLVRKLTLVDQQLEALDKLAGQFLQLSMERGGRVSTAYAECADLLARTVRDIRKNT